MLTSYTDSYGVGVIYDGIEFFLMPLEANAIQVTCSDGMDEWHFYGDGIYESFADACLAIFYGTICVIRTECGNIELDKFGNIVAVTPLSYYES